MSALDDAIIGSALPPGVGGLVSILRAYFDESGTGSPRSRLVTMAGLLSTPENWRRLSRDWNRTLKRHGVVGEYKADHCTRGVEQYERWLARERNALRRELGEIIDKRVLYATVVSVKTTDFGAEVGRFVDSGLTFSNPYPWCLRTCLEYIAQTPLRRGKRVACVFDDGHGFRQRAFDYFRDTLHAAKKWERVFFPSLNAAPSHLWPPLQAAEWMVYESRQDMDMQLFRAKKQHDIYAGIFRSMVIEGGTFDAHALATIMRPLFAYEQRKVWDMWAAAVAAGDVP